MPSAAQPSDGQKGALLSPKCHGCGLRVNEANSTAVPMNTTAWMNVATTVKVGLPSSEVAPVITATIPTATSVPTSATKKATGAYQAGQRGASPSGSSGRLGGGWGSAYCSMALRRVGRAPRQAIG